MFGRHLQMGAKNLRPHMRGHYGDILVRMMLAFRSSSLFVSKKFLNSWKFFATKCLVSLFFAE